jgi:CBS domain containing-hemolysin-like protein
MTVALQIVAAVVLLAGNAFFVAVEFSVTRARPTMVAQLVEQRATGAASLDHAVKHIDTYLSACQLGITVCSIGLGITAEPLITGALEQFFGESDLLGIASATLAFAIAYALVSMFHVVLGELAPKSLAIARTRSVGLVLLPPMRAFYVATKPVVDLFNWLGNLVLRPFGVPPASEADDEVHSEAELRALIAESERRGVLDPEEERFAVGAFTFGDRQAEEIMVPRREVVTVGADQDAREAVRTAASTGHRRLVLLEPDGDLDAPLGLIHLGDVASALADRDGDDLRTLARPLHETSRDTLLDDLLDELRDRGQRIALVRDPHGTALGIVSLQDILEQVVGDLHED